jgi:hypothetical protein
MYSALPKIAEAKVNPNEPNRLHFFPQIGLRFPASGWFRRIGLRFAEGLASFASHNVSDHVSQKSGECRAPCQI